MADALPKEVLDSAVQPSQIARQKFDVERRGFDQAQVRTYLISVADSLRDAQDREAEMRTRLGKAIRRAERAEASVRDNVAEDPSALTRQLGDEVAGVLDAARVAGEQKVAAAENSAKQLMSNAKAEATEIRRAAETILDERRAEADAVSEELLSQTRAEAEQLVATAQRDADALRQDAAADVARARDEGDALVNEAEEARAQILQDMDRRRRQARAQVERLRVGRDRLLRSYEVVRRTLDESTTELKGSLNEAKVLGDTAARRVAGESPASPHALEAEMADARLVRSGAGSAKNKGPAAKQGAAKQGAATKTDATKSDVRAEAPKDGAKPTPKDAAPLVPTTETGRSSSPQTMPAAPKSSATSEIKIPHVDMRTAAMSGDVAPTPRRPIVQDASVPKPPALAPMIKAPVAKQGPPETSDDGVDQTHAAHGQTSAVATLVADVEGAAQDDIDGLTRDDHDFSDLPTDELAIIEASDDIEEVIALVADLAELDGLESQAKPPAVEAGTLTETEPATGLFAALREQANLKVDAPTNADLQAADDAEREAAAVAAQQAADEHTAALEAASDLARQRDAVIGELTGDIEKRLKRALADEQNDVLAGIRSAGRASVELISLVGETDDHVLRYVAAIHEVAASAYGAGAALVDGEAASGEMPAGAVEELLGTAVVLPVRMRLLELDAMETESAAAHLDSIRAFYRQRKTDHLAEAASGLAGLLVTAGACDVLPTDQPIPWLAVSS